LSRIEARDGRLPMPSEEQKVTLVVQGDDLPTLEFRQRREKSLEHAPDGVSETRDKVVEYKLRVMGCCSRVALLPRSEVKQYALAGHSEEETYKDFFCKFNRS
jgi:hypothetical protein